MAMTPIGSGNEALYMALMELEQEQHDGAREIRRAEQDAAVHASMEAADHMENAAIWGALAGAARGAAQIGGGIASGCGGQGTAASGGQGTSLAIQGGGQVAAAGLDLGAGLENADVERCKASAQAHEAAAQDARDVEERARDVRQGLLRRMEQADESRNDAMRAALRA